MNREIVVDVQQSEISIALLEDKNLVELHKESKDTSFSVGDIYLGRVKKIMPGLNAAFVDVGYEKDAFLHYLDLGNNFNMVNSYVKQVTEKKKAIPIQKVPRQKELNKDGTIADVLTVGQNILVQLTKEPISTKGPRLTSEISIAGRNLVLIPFGDKISVSQKIKSSEERNRLRQLMLSVKPKNFGVIIRTVAEGKKVAELDTELRVLVDRWEKAVEQMLKTTKAPALVQDESHRAVSILRDIFSPDFEAIYVNDKYVYSEIQSYVTLISPEQKNIVKLYQSEIPVFDNFNITKQLKSSFGKIVSIKNGAYLVLEHTEALHVIDVNSGNRTKSSKDQETNALEVNLAAAAEIARQLRLRDMGGIIVIDFIDLQNSANRQLLYEKMLESMSPDRTKHKILPLSKFGLMQITRQRVRPEMNIDTEEYCPSCNGKGKSQPSILFTDTLENKIDCLVNQLKINKFILYVHPYVYAFINKGFFSLKWKWKFRYGFGVRVLPMQELAFLQYKFVNRDKDDIDIEEALENCP